MVPIPILKFINILFNKKNPVILVYEWQIVEVLYDIIMADDCRVLAPQKLSNHEEMPLVSAKK